jgi:hypothetical protein
LGTSANTRACEERGAAKLLRRNRRALNFAMASGNSPPVDAAASSAACGSSRISESRRATTVALRGSPKSHPASPTNSPRAISAVNRAWPVKRTPSRPLARRYTPSGEEPESNSTLPAGSEK